MGRQRNWHTNLDSQRAIHGNLVGKGSPNRACRCLKSRGTESKQTNPPACGEHTGGPLLIARLRRIEVTAPREFRGGQSLNHYHRGAAVWATPARWEIRWLIDTRQRRIAAQQPPAKRKATGAPSICQESEMPDSNESFRQHVQEEASQKLDSRQRHLALRAAMRVILPTE